MVGILESRRRILDQVVMSGRRVAILHEWLVTIGGSEMVLAELVKMFPEADIFTLVDTMSAEAHAALGIPATRTSILQRIPAIERRYRSLLPLFPLAVRMIDVSRYDLLISNSHAAIKAVPMRDDQCHVSYCLSPMRYAWDLREQYLRESGLDRGIKGAAARAMLEALRRWDKRQSDNVDEYSTLSHYVADRIKRAYGRDATVVYPPVATDFYTPPEDDAGRDDFYLTASRFVPYKRMDLIAQAFTGMPERRLLVVGDGPDSPKVRAAAGPNVELLGHVSREKLRDLLRRARAFLFAADEDFGIAPVEAQACGTPVIAYGRGGALETVCGDGPNRTGLFFAEQTAEAIRDAVERFESMESAFSRAACRHNAEGFAEDRFRREMGEFIEGAWAHFQETQLSRQGSTRGPRAVSES